MSMTAEEEISFLKREIEILESEIMELKISIEKNMVDKHSLEILKISSYRNDAIIAELRWMVRQLIPHKTYRDEDA